MRCTSSFPEGTPPPAGRQAGRLFLGAAEGIDTLARIDRLEWSRNVDGVKRDRNSNPYAVLAMADRQLVVDAGASVQGRGGTLVRITP